MWILKINGEVLNLFSTRKECELEAENVTRVLGLTNPAIDIYLDNLEN